MRKILLSSVIAALVLCVFVNKAMALIVLDDESVKIAIKYGLENKFSTSKILLGPNWLDNERGVIVNIYTPFIQLATKAKSQNVPGTSEEDIRLVKRRLGRQLKQIRTRDEVRFIVQLVGAKEDFGNKVKAHVEPYIPPEEKPTEEELENRSWFQKITGKLKDGGKVYPEKSILQDVATLDSYNPALPYSVVNSYNFDFGKIKDYDQFYLILSTPNEEPVKFLINRDEIF